jgi:hypothetical protein
MDRAVDPTELCSQTQSASGVMLHSEQEQFGNVAQVRALML